MAVFLCFCRYSSFAAHDYILHVLKANYYYNTFLCDFNWTRTHNLLVPKRTPNHFAKLVKWLSWVVSTYLYIWLYVLVMSRTRLTLFCFSCNPFSLIDFTDWIQSFVSFQKKFLFFEHKNQSYLATTVYFLCECSEFFNILEFVKYGIVSKRGFLTLGQKLCRLT